jgi:hypothetical protein
LELAAEIAIKTLSKYSKNEIVICAFGVVTEVAYVSALETND